MSWSDLSSIILSIRVRQGVPGLVHFCSDTWRNALTKEFSFPYEMRRMTSVWPCPTTYIATWNPDCILPILQPYNCSWAHWGMQLCHPYAALPHSGLYGNGHFPITRHQIPYLHFQKLQFLSKWEAQSTIFKGRHFLPTLSIKCLVTINFYLGNGFSFQSHGLKLSLFEHFLSSCL